MSDSENDNFDKEVYEIIEKVNNKKKACKDEDVTITSVPTPIKKRKPRGPPSEKQRKALEGGRRIRERDIEIKRLEREKKRVEGDKKLARLKREKAAREDVDEKGKDDQIGVLQKQIEEMKQQLNTRPNQPIINVNSAPAINPKTNDQSHEAYMRELRKYAKI